jgi:hypothetical protein
MEFVAVVVTRWGQAISLEAFTASGQLDRPEKDRRDSGSRIQRRSGEQAGSLKNFNRGAEVHGNHSVADCGANLRIHWQQDSEQVG